MDKDNELFLALQEFASDVSAKMSQQAAGEPEDQLRSPFENLMKRASKAMGLDVVCTGETRVAGRVGRPDFAVHFKKLLSGYVELKAPGVGARTETFKGHNHEQWDRFKAIPNILYSDGNEWALYRSGERVSEVVKLSGDIRSKGKKAVALPDAEALDHLLRLYLNWQPIIPVDSKKRIDLRASAKLLAPLCGLLRDDVTEALRHPESPLVQLASEWRDLLFPEATDEQFSDAYAQTVAFALLLGRSEGAEPLTLDSAVAALAAQHSLLSRALLVLTDEAVQSEMKAALELLLRIIGAVPSATFSGQKEPWLYFYEDFLAVYDPKLRKDAGAYYTPVEVVHAQVRLIDDLLENRLHKPLGFVDPGVITLDPAAGTGTYLLGVIEHALGRIKAEQGEGAVAGQASVLANNLYGFEIMVGPYAVTELRVTRALRDHGATLPTGGTHIYLTDTLESPHTKPAHLPFYLKPISDQHKKALEVKSGVPVIVCLGNPPYDRHAAATSENKASTGGWVRWGDDGKGAGAILRSFLDPAIKAGHGGDIKNLYNLYVYFWRWALWKVFEHATASGPGVVSFISASSYIDGDAFSGMREHMRRQCDEIWILDLGGEGRGTRKTENVFNIQTPVAIAVAVRKGKAALDAPANVHYAVIDGSRAEKLRQLDSIESMKSVMWQDCPTGWQAPLRPAGQGVYFYSPDINDLLPWSGRGIQFSRTWPVACDTDILSKRWSTLLLAASSNQCKLLYETRDVKAKNSYLSFHSEERLAAISTLAKDAQPDSTCRIAYRSFDRQFCIGDRRVIDMPRPALWSVLGEKQVFLITLADQPLDGGPALTTSCYVPDLNSFKGVAGGLVRPLYRTADATEPNILPGLLDLLCSAYKRAVSPEDFLAYIYGTLAQPAFTSRYTKELETRELRVPVTKGAALFEKVRAIGARLLWLHTYGERYVPPGMQRGHVPPGFARCVKAVPEDAEHYPETFVPPDGSQTLKVGLGEFRPVSCEVFDFEVSGLKVVQSWLKYRMKKGAGKKSSPLDNIRPEKWTGQFTTELLQLLWVLEATIAGYPAQAELLDEVVSGPCFKADELPPVPDEMRKPPSSKKAHGDLLEPDDEG